MSVKLLVGFKSHNGLFKHFAEVPGVILPVL